MAWNLTRAPIGGAGPIVWSLQFVRCREIAPYNWRLSAIGEDLEGRAFFHGQVVKVMAHDRGVWLERAFAIESFDAQELRLDLKASTRGDKAAQQWIRSVRIGDSLRVRPLTACGCRKSA
jgi:hypothetical protein